MRGLTVNIAVEGATDLAVADRLCGELGLLRGPVFGQRGKQHLDKSLPGFNAAAEHGAWFVLRDLDHDATCAPEMMSVLLPTGRRPRMLLRIAVRSIEAWLLADAAGISKWLGVASSLVPALPETVDDPKATFLGLARRSRSRALRDALLPKAGSGA